MLPDPTKRARHLHGHFERVPALGLATGEVWCSPRLDAVACWIAPGRWPTTDAEMAASGLDRSEEVTDGRHGDLWVIGVEPGSQGQGLGRALLEPFLQRADPSGDTCYLETLDERIGFEVHVAEVEASSGLPYWCCVRPPRDQDTMTAPLIACEGTWPGRLMLPPGVSGLQRASGWVWARRRHLAAARAEVQHAAHGQRSGHTREGTAVSLTRLGRAASMRGVGRVEYGAAPGGDDRHRVVGDRARRRMARP